MSLPDPADPGAIVPGSIVTVYAVFGSDSEARSIARKMVEEQLAACANILSPCHSYYRWDGQIEEAVEVPVLFKTRADGAQALIDRIAALHSYDLPAAVSWAVLDTLPAYASWVEEMVRR